MRYRIPLFVITQLTGAGYGFPLFVYFQTNDKSLYSKHDSKRS